MNADLYKVLGVASDATAKQINKAYKALARAHHPDVNADTPGAEDRFKEISAAYDVLGNEEKRTEYDNFQAMVGSGLHGGAFSDSGHSYDGTSVDDQFAQQLFAEMFARANRPRVHTVLRISFADSVRGATRTVDTPFGPMPITIPAGVESGSQMALRADDGDLIVEFDVARDATFGRSGPGGINLTRSIPISFAEAALGAKVKVTTFDGSTITIKIPAGTPTGRTFRVSGRGVAPSQGGRPGNLLVTVTVATPTDLTPEQQDALRIFSENLPPVRGE